MTDKAVTSEQYSAIVQSCGPQQPHSSPFFPSITSRCPLAVVWAQLPAARLQCSSLLPAPGAGKVLNCWNATKTPHCQSILGPQTRSSCSVDHIDLGAICCQLLHYSINEEINNCPFKHYAYLYLEMSLRSFTKLKFRQD